MARIASRSLPMVALGLGICAASAAPLPERLDPRKAAQAAILDLSEKLDQKGVEALARKIVREHESDNISSVFQRLDRGGLGLGDYARAVKHPNSVQALINYLSRQQPPAQKLLSDHQADLLRTAKVIQAMAELAPYRVPKYANPADRRIQEWVRVSADFKKDSREFRLAIESKDPVKVRSAADRLNHSCCDCHNLLD
jgi:hypothetical protein